METEINSFDNYIDNGTLYTHFSEFEDKSEIVISSKDKRYALICFEIKNKNFISDAFGATSAIKVDEYAARVICSIISDRGFVLSSFSGTILVFFSYEKRSEIEAFVEKTEKMLKECSFFGSYDFTVDLVSGIYQLTNSISVQNAADKLFSAITHTNYTSGSFFYDSTVDEKVSKEIEIIKSVDSAMENGEFHIYLQPQHYLQHEDRVLSAEALIRWIKSDGTIVYPGDFIPVLERNGMITKLDCHVMELACRFISQHLNESWFDDIVISVNVSKVDLKLSDFIEYYTNIRNKYKIPDGRIEIEFTESAVFEDYSVFKQIMLELRKSGFYCSIDDFGTGSSSLNMLKSMPVDVLKMDRMFFVTENDNDIERNNSVIASVVAMARGLGMKIVAEGIESPERIDFLRKIGCDVIQGYVYSKPLSLEEFEEYVKNYIPKYLPITETLKPVEPERQLLNDKDALYQRYIQVLPYVNAFVMDIEVESDTYGVISFGQGRIIISEPEGKYSSFFENSILRQIHKDFKQEALKNLSLKGIISSFYRGDSEINIELMIKPYDLETVDSNGFAWCQFKICFQKFSKSAKPVATLYISDITEQKEQEMYVLSAQRRLKATLKGLICEIYDYDIKNKTAELLHTGIKKSNAGEMQSGNAIKDFGRYLKTSIHSDDREKISDILAKMEKTDSKENEDYYAEYRAITPSGNLRWKSIHFMVDNDHQAECATMIVNDIDERKIAELKVERNSRRDKNTGVYNIDDFCDAAQEFIEREGRSGEHVMIMLSISEFEKIFTEKGNKYSSELEAAFVKCLRKAVRKDDIIGKYEDGRFALFLKGIGAEYIQRFVNKTREIFNDQFYEETSLSEFRMGISTLVNKNKSIQRMSMETLGALEHAEKTGTNEIMITSL